MQPPSGANFGQLDGLAIRSDDRHGWTTNGKMGQMELRMENDAATHGEIISYSLEHQQGFDDGIICRLWTSVGYGLGY